jgi:hypothetical protein
VEGIALDAYVVLNPGAPWNFFSIINTSLLTSLR